MNLTTSKSPEFTQHYSTKLADYVTALAWSSKGEILAASSAAGEIVLWENHQLITLQKWVTNIVKLVHAGGL
ncbi:MAG: hypothetical protein ACKPFJ_06095 [Dolichospermum sp.]